MGSRRMVALLLLVGFGWNGVAALPPERDDISASPLMSQRRSRPRHVNRMGEMPEFPSEAPTSERSPEPTVRIALAVDVLQATVSSTAPLATVLDDHQQQVVLQHRAVSVTLDATGKDSPPVYDVRLVARGDRRTTAPLLRKVRSQLNASASASYTPATGEIIVRIGRFGSKSAAEAVARRARTLGYRSVRVVPLESNASASSRLVVRTSDGAPVMRLTDRVTLFPSDPEAAVIFNNRAYRGRILIVRNPRHRLTVINELGLEQYLLGVVPNELNPTAFAEIEALKAQAVAARTYALRNLGKYAGEGYDLYDDVRSQVYGGKSSEHPLASRAVEETRGIVATYGHRPIEAVFTSTCGGRTENSEAIFGKPEPYLRSTVCAPEKGWLAPQEIVTTRRETLDRTLALLRVAGVMLPRPLTEAVLAEKPSADELRSWVGALARALHLRAAAPVVMPTSSRRHPKLLDRSGFVDLLVENFYPEGYADLFFTPEDLAYLLDYPDADQIPRSSRASFALLLSDGILTPFPDGTLRPKAPIARQEALTMLGRMLDRFDSAVIQAGQLMNATPTTLTVKTAQGKAATLSLEPDLFLFKQIAGHVTASSAIRVIGGERLRFHVNSRGRIDYLEIEPSRAGVASDRYSPYAHWEVSVTRDEISRRLRDKGVMVGPVVDLRIVRRGASGRVIELEIIGRQHRQRVRGQAIRTLFNLRDTLFVIERRRDTSGAIQSFVFIGRGWGHGVGLCQMGAYGLALSGASYDRILRTYYRGIRLEKLY
ncbi:MAG TPA: SpoIID/LytB domain-containing protein [Blastocatellia bacterium]|nr:SpoIID/LytB domain-containing protein [Blastocatellia bacterium]